MVVNEYESECLGWVCIPLLLSEADYSSDSVVVVWKTEQIFPYILCSTVFGIGALQKYVLPRHVFLPFHTFSIRYYKVGFPIWIFLIARPFLTAHYFIVNFFKSRYFKKPKKCNTSDWCNPILSICNRILWFEWFHT